MQSYNPLDAIVFDLDDVVFPFDADVLAHSLAGSLGLAADRVRAILAASDAIARARDGRLDTSELPAELETEIGSRVGIEPAAEGLAPVSPDTLAAAVAAASGDPYPGIVELLERLATSVRLVALTNATPVHAAVWRDRYAGVLALFDHVLFSCQIGAVKPDEAAFDAVMDRLEVPPDEIGYVDDDVECVYAASAFGFRAFEAGNADAISDDLDPHINLVPDGE